MDERLDAVRELWATYREHGVEQAIQLLHPEVEFVDEDGMRGAYLFFAHGFRDGRVSRIAAHTTKQAALADMASRYRGQAWPS